MIITCIIWIYLEKQGEGEALRHLKIYMGQLTTYSLFLWVQH